MPPLVIVSLVAAVLPLTLMLIDEATLSEATIVYLLIVLLYVALNICRAIEDGTGDVDIHGS